MTRPHRSLRFLIVCLVSASLSACATLRGGPGLGPCAPYLASGALTGVDLATASATTREERVQRGTAGAVVGTAAGYALCMQVWREKQELLDVLAAAGGGTGRDSVVRSVEAIDDNTALQLDFDLRFATGSALLEPRALPTLAALAGHLHARPASTLEIRGHTDSTGNANRNRSLSRSRADAVAAFLVEHGVGAARISIAGMGSDEPVADNATEAGRERNRRVEIVIHPRVS